MPAESQPRKAAGPVICSRPGFIAPVRTTPSLTLGAGLRVVLVCLNEARDWAVRRCSGDRCRIDELSGNSFVLTMPGPTWSRRTRQSQSAKQGGCVGDVGVPAFRKPFSTCLAIRWRSDNGSRCCDRSQQQPSRRLHMETGLHPPSGYGRTNHPSLPADGRRLLRKIGVLAPGAGCRKIPSQDRDQ